MPLDQVTSTHTTLKILVTTRRQETGSQRPFCKYVNVEGRYLILTVSSQVLQESRQEILDSPQSYSRWHKSNGSGSLVNAPSLPTCNASS